MPNAIPVVHHSLSVGRQEGRLISFAVANTPETQAAFAWACSNLFHSIDRIILIHVYDGDSLFNLQSKQSGLTVLHHYRSQCEQKGFKCEIVHAHGSTASVIAEITKSRGCDLCVCGSRGLNAFKRTVLGSVSSKVSQLCECPVMVIKKPRDEAGAFLQVLPRRVFFYVDPENSSHAFQWGLEKLLDPQIDEVYMLANYSFASRKIIPLADREEMRVQMETTMQNFEAKCQEKGIRSVNRLRVNSTDQMLQTALANSCDTLVIGRNMQGRKGVDGGLYSAHNASFPVVVVNHNPNTRTRPTPTPRSPASTSQSSVLSSTTTEFRYADHSGSWKDAGSWKGKAATKIEHARIEDLEPALPCLKNSASSDSQHLTKSSSAVSGADSLAQDAAVLAKSSSLEALLNNLEDIEDPCVSRSRRCDDGEEEEEEERHEQAALRTGSRSCEPEVEVEATRGRNCGIEETEKEPVAEIGGGGGGGGMEVGKKKAVGALARSISVRRFSRSMSELMDMVST